MTSQWELWFAIGMVAGGLHGWMLWRMSQPPHHAAAWHLPRFLLIGGVLLVAAMWDGLLPAFAGWMIAYAAAVGIVAMGQSS